MGTWCRCSGSDCMRESILPKVRGGHRLGPRHCSLRLSGKRSLCLQVGRCVLRSRGHRRTESGRRRCPQPSRSLRSGPRSPGRVGHRGRGSLWSGVGRRSSSVGRRDSLWSGGVGRRSQLPVRGLPGRKLAASGGTDGRRDGRGVAGVGQAGRAQVARGRGAEAGSLLPRRGGLQGPLRMRVAWRRHAALRSWKAPLMRLGSLAGQHRHRLRTLRTRVRHRQWQGHRHRWRRPAELRPGQLCALLRAWRPHRWARGPHSRRSQGTTLLRRWDFQDRHRQRHRNRWRERLCPTEVRPGQLRAPLRTWRPHSRRAHRSKLPPRRRWRLQDWHGPLQ